VIRVILAGEGKNELGDLALEAAYRSDEKAPGVVETLLRQVRRDGWEVVDAVLWKKLPKLQVGLRGRGEELNVLRAHHHAKRRGCDVFAFTRDRDGVKFAHRDDDVERALATLKESGDGPAVIGGVAIEKLESWLVAVAGHARSEEMRRPEERLAELGVREKATEEMVRLVEERGLAGVPGDARSLRRWLDRARAALGEDGPSIQDST
jgi:hypothetical protein